MADYRTAEVVWIDSATNGAWDTVAAHEERGIFEVHSVGYLLRRDANRIILAQSQSNEGTVTDCLTIPAVCVKKVRYLK